MGFSPIIVDISTIIIKIGAMNYSRKVISTWSLWKELRSVNYNQENKTMRDNILIAFGLKEAPKDSFRKTFIDKTTREEE